MKVRRLLGCALPDADRDFVEVFSAARQGLATSYTTAPVVGLLVDDIVEAREERAAAGGCRADRGDPVGREHERIPLLPPP